MINYSDLDKFFFKEGKILNKTLILLGSFFLTGFLKFAPGTISCALSLPLLVYLNSFNPKLYLAITILLVVFSFYVCDKISKNTDNKDPKFVVLDEIIGMNISLVNIEISIINLIVAFTIFRTLDILKPFPISYIDRKTKGGIGIVMDDLLAGLATNLIMKLIS